MLTKTLRFLICVALTGNASAQPPRPKSVPTAPVQTEKSKSEAPRPPTAKVASPAEILARMVKQAEDGSPTARVALARRLAQSGGPRRAEALMWLILATRGPFGVADFGGAPSLAGTAKATAKFLREAEELEQRLRTSMPSDLVAAAEKMANEWLPPKVARAKQLAIKGDPVAQFEFGWMLKSPRLIGEPRHEEAQEWFRRSAEQGYPAAQYSLARQFMNVKGREAEASSLFAKALEQGYPAAQHAMGERYARGEGVPQSMEQACNWYLNAAEQGEFEALGDVADCYASGRGMKQDQIEAYKWLLIQKPRERAEYVYVINDKLADLSKLMTVQQISEAKKRAATWQSRPPVQKAWKATRTEQEPTAPVTAPVAAASTPDPPPLKPGARLIEWSSLTDCDVVRGHKLSNTIEFGFGATGGGTAAYVLRPIPPTTRIEMAPGRYGSKVLSGTGGRPPTASVMTGMILGGKPEADFYSALGVGTKMLLPNEDVELCGVRMKSGDLEITDRGFVVTVKP